MILIVFLYVASDVSFMARQLWHFMLSIARYHQF